MVFNRFLMCQKKVKKMLIKLHEYNAYNVYVVLWLLKGSGFVAPRHGYRRSKKPIS